ncbi:MULTISPECIES: RDD family protein [Bradyrhizobium]|uniref:RDD family protein n=1 Tax=Bradyrhizobium TaxID=374 RepID=UPI0012FEFF0D|nr:MULTISPECIES: RDD family protein [Bradyrhizobium]
MSVASTVPSAAAAPLYARFSRRFRGIFIDWIVTLLTIAGALLVASTVAIDSVSRALGFAVIAALVLYEPVLVSFTGGTVGHHLTNLRVVDDATGGNVGFLKACARLLIKSFLGWYSFVIIAATRRNQAIHDLVTRSTVQIRDPAKARPGQFVTERIEETRASLMPARWQRILVTLLYLLLTFFFVTLLAVIAETLLGGCAFHSCAPVLRVVGLVLDVGLLLAMAGIIALGWKGKLPGARVSRASR